MPSFSLWSIIHDVRDDSYYDDDPQPRQVTSPASTRVIGPSLQSVTDLPLQLRTLVRKACDVRGFRDQPLSELELAMSFYIFVMWNSVAVQEEQEGRTDAFRFPNVSAREAAIALVSGFPGILVEAIHARVPTFDRDTEVQWGLSAVNHPEWKACFTRAMVLGCRQLAYSLCAATGWVAPINNVEFGLYFQHESPERLLDEHRAWLRETLGPAPARVLLGA